MGREGFPENRINLCAGASYWAVSLKGLRMWLRNIAIYTSHFARRLSIFFGRIYIRLVQMITARVMMEITMIPVRRQFLQTLPKVFNVITDSPD